jgi:NitT/TauT family transport system substrate-binding protein
MLTFPHSRRVITSLLVLMSLAATMGADPQNDKPIVVAVTATEDAAPLLYAQKAGLFRQAGLNVDIQKTPSGAAGMAAVVGGSFQFSGTNVLSTITAHLKGLPVTLVAPGGLYDSTTNFVAGVVKKTSTLQTARDLNGHTIGLPSVSDLNAISLFGWIDQNGGDSKSVKSIEVPYPLLIPALDEGRIDAAVLIQPNLSDGLISNKVRVLGKPYDSIGKRFYITAWVANASWVSQNPAIARGFAAVMKRAAAYANTHLDEMAPLVAAWSGVDVQTIQRGGRDTFATGDLDARDIQPVIDAALRYKAIDRRFDATEVIAPAVRKSAP